MSRPASSEASGAPKNAEANCLAITGSLRRQPEPLVDLAPSACPARSVASDGILGMKTAAAASPASS